MGNKQGGKSPEEINDNSNTQPLRPSRLAKAGAASVNGNRTHYEQVVTPNSASGTTQTTKQNQKSPASQSNINQKSPVSQTYIHQKSPVTQSDFHQKSSVPYNDTKVYPKPEPKKTIEQYIEPPKVEQELRSLDQSRDQTPEIQSEPVPYVSPPQTKLWEQKQQIQLQIETETRRQQRKKPKVTEDTPAYTGLINGRASGFDPDRFKQANNEGNNRTPIKSSTPIQHNTFRSPPSSTPQRVPSFDISNSATSLSEPASPAMLDVNDEDLMNDILEDIGM